MAAYFAEFETPQREACRRRAKASLHRSFDPDHHLLLVLLDVPKYLRARTARIPRAPKPLYHLILKDPSERYLGTIHRRNPHVLR